MKSWIVLNAVLQCFLSGTLVHAEIKKHVMVITVNSISRGTVDDHIDEIHLDDVVDDLDEIEDKCRKNEFHPGTLIATVENVDFYEDCAVICRNIDQCLVITFVKTVKTCLMAREMAEHQETFKELTTEYCELEKIQEVSGQSDDEIEDPDDGQPFFKCGQPKWPLKLTTTSPGTGTSRKKRILDGGRPTHYSLPWMVDLEDVTGDHFCGGTLIAGGRNLKVSTTNSVLTAGHCVAYFDNVTNHVKLKGRKVIYARAGSMDRRFTEAHEQRYHVRKAVVYGGYGEYNGRLKNDIAVLEVAGMYKFNDYVRPICLPDPTMPLTIGQSCFIAGWGREESVGSPYLKAAEVSISSMTNDGTGQKPAEINTLRHCRSECTGNARKGDSGSPLINFNVESQAFFIVGVHSMSHFYPRTITNKIDFNVKQIENEAMDVRRYVNWIVNVVTPDFLMNNPDWLTNNAYVFYL